jgi:hypothetical protein
MPAMHDLTERRIRYWTIVLALAGPLAFFSARVLMNVVSGPILVILVLFLRGATLLFVVVTWVGVAFFDLLAVVMAAYERAWRRLLSSAVVFLVALATAANFGVAWNLGAAAGDYVHLFALYPRYMAEISDLPEPRFKAWQWHFAGPCGSGIVYDESDAIASQHRSTSDGLVATVDVYGNSRAFGHFYFASFC